MRFSLMKSKEHPTTKIIKSMLPSINKFWMQNVARHKKEEQQSLLKLLRSLNPKQLSGKRRKDKSPLRLIDEPSDEGVPVKEPAHDDEEADLQRALELSLKEQEQQTQGPARPVVLKEPNSEKFQPLPEVQGKGKEKVIEEQDAHYLLTLQTLMKKKSNEEASKINARNKKEGQAGPNPGVQDKGQAGPNPGVQDECHAGINPKPASSTRTLSSLQNIDKDLSFTDQFFVKKTQEEEPGKTNVEVEVQSMVSVPIHQDTSSVPPMTTLVIDLMTMQSDSPLPTSTATTSIITTTTSLSPPPQPQQSTTDPILISHIGELEQHMTDLIQNNLALEERLGNASSTSSSLQGSPTVNMKEIIQQRMFEDDSYKAHTIHNDLYEALKKLLELDYSNQRLADQEEARKKRRKRRDIPRTPPGSPPSQPLPPAPPAGASGTLGTLGASGSSQLPPPSPPLSTSTSGSAQQQGNKAPSSSKPAASASQSMAWTTSDTRYESADSETDHQSKADSRKDWWKPLPEEERPATPEPT
ncbi:retrovirus-related pol polyprotein from transposon TNT 1-94 [Tanacetum coccineum]